MVDESYFRMPNIPTPDSTGVAPIFNKYITYNKRKDSFSISKNTFDSYRNFLNFFLLIHLFKDEYMDELGLLEDNILSSTEVRKSQEESINTDVVSSDVTTETEKIIETQVNTSTEVIDTVPVDIIVDENPVEIQPTSLNKSDENNEQTTKI